MKASLKMPHAWASKVQSGDRNHREILMGRFIRGITKGYWSDRELDVTSTESYRTQAEQVQGGALRLTWGSQGRPPPLALLEQARMAPCGRQPGAGTDLAAWRRSLEGLPSGVVEACPLRCQEGPSPGALCQATPGGCGRSCSGDVPGQPHAEAPGEGLLSTAGPEH